MVGKKLDLIHHGEKNNVFSTHTEPESVVIFILSVQNVIQWHPSMVSCLIVLKE